jgi:LPS-assembly lipoprotein
MLAIDLLRFTMFSSTILKPVMLRSTMSGLRRYITLALLVSLIQACGFQLRGALDLSEDISPIYLQQNNLFELGREIKALLNANKLQIAENEQQAKAQLALLSEGKSRRVLSVDSNGRGREYLLNYTVNFSIKVKQTTGINQQGRQDTISVRRSLVYEPEAVLAVANESEILYKDMQRDVARLILLRLQASSRQNANMDSDDNKTE